MSEVLLLTDPGMCAHDPGRSHPERPERLRSLQEALDQRGLTPRAPKTAELDHLLRVHAAPYIGEILSLRGQRARLDPDTALSEDSVPAALSAAGAGLDLVSALLEGPTRRAFALVRPPGHHAIALRGMGFCLFNNIAVAAAEALARGLERVLIVDWDVHHGNGTADIFAEDPRVLVFNTHQYPFYPGTGHAAELGEREGEGRTVNVPLPAGVGDGDLHAVYAELLAPIAEAFAPQLILVSAGFDGHRLDPLASMEMTGEGYAGLCAAVLAQAERSAEGRIGLFLEGGYDLTGLHEGVFACLDVLGGASAELEPDPSPRGRKAIDQARAIQKAHWSV